MFKSFICVKLKIKVILPPIPLGESYLHPGLCWSQWPEPLGYLSSSVFCRIALKFQPFLRVNAHLEFPQDDTHTLIQTLSPRIGQLSIPVVIHLKKVLKNPETPGPAAEWAV